ncbi:MAG: ZIP family metal transporter [Candidatus Caldatribacterium sp.]|uniref:ZIP family metal transporter n=1 Tax=Candidatus Caldatribacterium sp. TaxID=2282143 RepID=UPI002998F8D7|nr:ZIP family metal transporter [Candidatus Caldatribacterium sp.]MCX7730077.1 ZIP family metal transporter [Candidatus Caldatribacterium sp.]MDW8081937.1 ZIP family metal transporter [Candidatus Calescibacterium sp.]
MNHVIWGIVGSTAAGLATGVGAIPVLFPSLHDLSHRMRDELLGFAAGVMLAATAFSLLVPAIESGGPGLAIGGILAGALLLDLLDRMIPHEHFEKGKEGPASTLRKIWLFVLAITLHNFPEGLAVGVSFGSQRIADGITVALAIGLQNVPEGLAVAVSLLGAGYSRKQAFLYALLTGLVEPLGGVLGIGLVSFMQAFLPFGLALAGGAMLFVIGDEIIPETHHGPSARYSTYALMVGFAIMMGLDTLFG